MSFGDDVSAVLASAALALVFTQPAAPAVSACGPDALQTFSRHEHERL